MTIPKIQSPLEEFAEIIAANVDTLQKSIIQWADGIRLENTDIMISARNKTIDTIRFTQMIADLAGRRRVLLETDAFKAGLRSQQELKFRDDVIAISTTSNIKTKGIPSVPFREAIEDIISREPRLATSAEAVQEAYSRGRVFALARVDSLESNITQRVQSAIAQAELRGTTVSSISDLIAEIGGFTKAYAETVFRTNISTAYTAGRFQQFNDPVIKEVIGGVLFSATNDSRVRPNHLAADGLVANSDDPIWSLIAPPLGYNSFHPDTIVEGQVEAGSKAFYSGPMVKIQTADGCSLSVTVNHPVLTFRGFVSASELRESDYLIKHKDSVESFIHRSGDGVLSLPFETGWAIDDKQMPARIEDIFEAFLAKRAGSIVQSFSSTRPLDFHGDARFYNGDVHIVMPNRFLNNSFEPNLPKLIEYPNFMQSGSMDFSAHGSGVALQNKAVRFGTASTLNVQGNQSTLDSATRGTKLLRKLKFRYPGKIKPNKIIKIEVFSYSGHVYDLQSPLGYIVTNGAITSNCRCAIIGVDRFSLERKGLLVNGRLRPARLPSEAFSDAGFNKRGRPDQLVYIT